MQTCARGHTANQQLCQEQKQGRQTLSPAQFHLISPRPRADTRRGGLGCTASSEEVILSLKLAVDKSHMDNQELTAAWALTEL